MMLGEESRSADFWKKCGDEALAHGVKGVIMMVVLTTIAIIIHLLMFCPGCSLGLQGSRQNRGSNEP